MTIGIREPLQRCCTLRLFVARRVLIPALWIAFMTVAVGCSDQREKQGATAGLTLFGTVDIREVQLAFQDAGRIRSLAVDEGARVQQGQVVAELDPVRYQLEVRRLAGEVAAQSQVVDRLHQGSRPQDVEKSKAGRLLGQISGMPNSICPASTPCL